MDYIEASEFLKRPEKVQKVLLDWWQPECSDLIGESNGDFCLVSELMSPSRPKVFKHKYIYSKKYVPLFTETQLRKFIEERTHTKMQIYHDIFHGYSITINAYKNSIHYSFGDEKEYTELKHDLLFTYWRTACLVAQEDFK